MENEPIAVDITSKPILKFPGGKALLVSEILPRVSIMFGTYQEPFVGGGALFFHLRGCGQLAGNVVLSDTNPELIGLYTVVRDDVDELLDALLVHEPHLNDADYHYALRSWDRQPDWSQRSAVERAARLLLLNKTCYNGVQRVNNQGQFNATFGRYRDPQVRNEPNLRAASTAIQGVDILVDDFAGVLDHAQPGDFLYFDPPYVPASGTAKFTGYTAGGFDIVEQHRVAYVVMCFAARGCHVLLSTAASPLMAELYKHFAMTEIDVRRSINCVGSKRGPVHEILVHAGPRA